jgi:thiol:disulfide interchange protein DsbD
MKKLLLLGIVTLGAFTAKAQLNPVTWTFTAKKISDKTYEISMTATLKDKWHLYSQIQPADVDVIPTTFTINANPLFTKEGKVKEVGTLEKYTDKELGVTLHQYSKTVTFVQKIKLKANVKTNFTGSVEYQTCDDHQCLPPKTVNFNVAIK